MDRWRVMIVRLLLAVVCVGMRLPAAVAQNEADIDDEELEDFLEDMADEQAEDEDEDEREGLEGELEEVRAAAQAVLTPPLRTWIEKEVPGLLERLERRRREMEREENIEGLIESYELQMDLPEWIERLREAKAEAAEALNEELLNVLKQEVPQVVAALDVDETGEDVWMGDVLERTIDRYWQRAELAEAAEELRGMREEAAEALDGEVRGIVESELPDGIELLKLLGRNPSARNDRPWEQVERRVRYYETHFYLARVGEELLELSGEGEEPDEEDFDEHPEDAVRLDRFKQFAALNIACELAAIRYHETRDVAECRRIAKSLQGDLAKAFDLSIERFREGELKSLERELHEVEDDEEGGEPEVIEELEREIAHIRRRLEDREKNRDIIIYRRFYELIEGEDPYAWE